jgi:hypothetical protein
MNHAEDLALLRRFWERARGRDTLLLELRPGLRGEATLLKPPPDAPAGYQRVFRVSHDALRIYLMQQGAL